MRLRAFREASLEVASVTATCLLALPAVRLLQHDGLPATHDGQGHLQRFAAFALDIGRGTLYPTWDPNLDVGYGSPVFGYYAPLPYYWAEIFHRLGPDVTASLWLAFAGTIVLSALTMYALCRAWGGRVAGIAGGVCFATVPYQLHDVYVRGALAESLALSLMPVSLLGFSQFAFGKGRAWLGIGAVGLAAVILAHNISALLFVPFVVVWCLLLIPIVRPRVPAGTMPRLLLSMAGGVLLGLGLAAFFWVPALAEGSFVDVQRAALNYDFHDYFNRVWPPIQTSWPVDYGYDPVRLPVRPGLFQVVAAAAGLAILFPLARGDEFRRRWLCLAALAPFGIVLLALQRPESAFLWDHLPLVRYIQFPYRLLAPFAVITAFLAGFTPLVLRAGPARLAVAFGVAVTSTTLGVAQLTVAYTGGLPTDLADEQGVLILEVARRNLAGAAASEYTPSWVTATTDSVLASVTEPRSAEDEGPSSPLEIRLVLVLPLRTELRVRAPAPATLVLRQFYAPGWHVMANGTELATHPLGELGLLSVEVPPGDWDLVAEFGLTRLEAVAASFSAVCLIALIALLATPGFRAATRIPMAWLPIVLLPAMATILMSVPARKALPIANEEPTSLAPGYQLVGAQLDTSGLSTTGIVRFTLFVFAQRTGADLLFRASAYDGQDTPVASATMRPWNGPTGYWVAGELAPAKLDLELPSGVALRDLTFTVETADARQPDIWLSKVKLDTGARANVTPFPYHILASVFGDKLLIQGYRLDRPEERGRLALKPGDGVTVTLDILSTHWIGEDQTAFVHLLGPDGRLKAQYDGLVGGKDLPTSRWLPGTLMRQQFPITLPANAATGRYRFEAGFYELATMRRLQFRDPLLRPAGDSLVFGDVIVQ